MSGSRSATEVNADVANVTFAAEINMQKACGLYNYDHLVGGGGTVSHMTLCEIRR